MSGDDPGVGAAPALLDKQKLKIQEVLDPIQNPMGWGSLFLTKAAPDPCAWSQVELLWHERFLNFTKGEGQG